MKQGLDLDHMSSTTILDEVNTHDADASAQHWDPNGSITTPINLLPTELVGQIIFFALQSRSTTDTSNFTETDPHETAGFRLVSRHWNDAALVTSEVWRGLQLNLDVLDPHTHVHTPRSLVNFVNTWFDRAGHSNPPLRWSIIGGSGFFTAGSGHPGYPNAQRFLAEEISLILFDTRRNWTHWLFNSALLYMTLVQYKGFEGAFNIFHPQSNSKSIYTNTIRKLQSLNIVRGEDMDPQYDDANPPRGMDEYRLFCDPKEVGMLQLQSIYIVSAPTSPEWPCGPLRTIYPHLPSHLRTIHLYGILSTSLRTLLRVFKLGPHLEEVIIESLNDSDFYMYSEDNSHVVNTSIRRLILLGQASIYGLSKILPHITLPSLNFLQLANLETATIRPHWSINNFASFFERSGLSGAGSDFHVSLEHLGGQYSISVPEMGFILRALQYGKITHLYLENSNAIYYGSKDTLKWLGSSLRAISWLYPPKPPQSRADWDGVFKRLIDGRDAGNVSENIEVYFPMAHPGSGVDEIVPNTLTGKDLPVSVHRLSPDQLRDRFAHKIEPHSYRPCP